MALFSIPGLRLSAVAAAVPRDDVHNRDLDLLRKGDGEQFIRAVGIESRRVAPPAICATDLCVAAAERLLEAAGRRPAEIGALVFVTQTPDYPLPGNSTLAQRRLGLPASACLLDLNQGCAGYVYGLASLASLLAATGIERGLLLAGDTLTRLLSPADRSTFPIFSDAGSATLLERESEAAALHFNLGGEGRGANVIRVEGGGARRPFGVDSLVPREVGRDIERAPVHLAMNGMDVLHYCLRYVAPSIEELLEFVECDLGTPHYFVFHQANRILNESLRRKLGIPEEKAPESLREYGNTSSATIPLTMCHRLGETLAGRPTKLLLAGFGAGFSWGSALVSSESVRCCPLLEIGDRRGS